MQKIFAIICVIVILILGVSCSENKTNLEPEFSASALERRKMMFEHAASFKNDPENPNALGGWNQTIAAIGREDLLIGLNGVYDDPAGAVCSEEEADNPLEKLVDLQGDQNVVIINEHHAMPAHRIFIRDLVVRLHAEGFTHYAAETLTPESLSRTGYPVTSDGWYTSEPMMARLIKTVRDLGYVQVAYEQTDEQRAPPDADIQTRIAARENAQVANLTAAVFDKDPETKIIVHVGHSHAAEEPIFGTEWMAARLKKATGIDPLTISLLACQSPSKKPVLSTTAINAEGDIEPRFTDYLVGLPALGFVNGRPTYRAEIGDLATDVPRRLLSDEKPIIVEARPVGASLESEAVERLFLNPGEALPLMLPRGKWSLISFDEQGSISKPEIVTVGD